MGQDNHNGGQVPGSGPDQPEHTRPGAAEPGVPEPGGRGTGPAPGAGPVPPAWNPPAWNPPPGTGAPQGPGSGQPPAWNPPPGTHQGPGAVPPAPGWNPPGAGQGSPGSGPQSQSQSQPQSPWGAWQGTPPQGGPGWGSGWGGPGPGAAAAYVPPPRPGIIPLRPLGLGEMLDGAFQACRRNPAATFGTAVLVMAVVSLLTWLLTRFGFDFNALFSSQEPSDADVLAFLGGYLGSSVLIGLVTGAGVLLLQGVLVLVVARAALDRRTGFGLLRRLAAPRLGRLVGLLLLYGAAVAAAALLVLGLTALSVPVLGWGAVLIALFLAGGVGLVSIWIGTKLALAPAALVLEGVGPVAALRRSWQLTGGNWWRAFGILLLTGLIAGIITSVVAAPVTFLAGLLAAAVAGDDPIAYLNLTLPATLIATNLFSAVAYAFQASVTSLLYVDLRIRREGFDVTLLREQERGTDPDAVPGAGPTAAGPPGAPGTPGTPGGPFSPGRPPAGPWG